MSKLDYPVVIRPLSEADGGGYIAFAPDLKGCMSVGETPVEALEGIHDAITEWQDAWTEMNRNMPDPGSTSRRMRDEHKEIANRLRELEATTDDLDARIRQLQNDLDDHIENLEAWDRFEGLAGPDKYSGAQDRKQQLGLRYDT